MRLLSKSASILIEVASTASANVIIILVSFGASVLAARLLGPAHRGTLAAAVVYVALASALADAGLNQAVPYFAARHKPQAPAVLGTTCVLAVILGSIVAAGTYLLLDFSDVDSRGAEFYLPSIPFGLLTTHLAAFMYGGGMFTQFNVIRVFQPALLLFALTIAAVSGRPDVSLVLTVAVVLSALLAGAAVITVGRRVPIRQWTVSAGMVRGLSGYALQSYVGNLCWLFNSRLDQLMMSFLLSAASLGIYATSASYAGVVFSFFSAFAMLTFAKASAVDGGNEPQVRGIIRRYLLLSLALGVPISVAVAVAAPWLYPFLFGAEFEAGVRPAMVLCAASVFLGLNYILSNGLRIRNQPLRPSIAEAIGLAVSVVGLLWVLPQGGIMGAAFVPLVSYVAVFGMLVHFSRARTLSPERDPVGSAS